MKESGRMIGISAALATVILAIGGDAVRAWPAATAVVTENPSDETSAIPMDPPFAVLRSAWSDRLRQKALADIVAMYAEDATYVDPAARTNGRVAVEQLMHRVMGEVDSTIVLESTRSERSGGLAVDSGTYREQLIWRVDGRRGRNRGSYLTVYRRADDGRWLIIEQSWTPGIPKS